ncbi:pantothenate kinase [Nakamurella sp. UYEF19]|uniref:nucleoside/nucleotide kinase family protein n=1 Tax=Nakamurella sp. UYEF19 TaxID=1756392 RepID=UPI00339532E3
MAGGVPVVPADAELLADRIRGLHRPGRRVLVGIIGAPGSGKSTLAAAVQEHLVHGPVPIPTALVPMDGYHLAQHVLDSAGTAEIKGAPQTFDAAGYVALLQRLVSARDHGRQEIVYAPEFRRAIEEPIAGAVPVGPEIEVVVTEGNYLLLDEEPWDQVKPLLTQAWYLDTPEDLRLERLVSRHIAFGRTPELALTRSTTGTDGRNAACVLATRSRADLLLQPI